MALTSRVSDTSGAVILPRVYGRTSSGRSPWSPSEEWGAEHSVIDSRTHSFYISPRDEVKGNSPEESQMIRILLMAVSITLAMLGPRQALSETAVKPADPAPIVALSPAELTAALKGGKPVVVEFGGETCIPCRQMQPVLQEIRTDLGKKGLVHNFWIQAHPEVARQFKVMAMPTQVVFDTKGTEVFRHIGVLPLPEFRKALKEKGIL